MESFSWHVLLAQIATFFVGAAALWFIAVKPISRILDERRRRIEEEFRSADEAREQAEAGERALYRKLAGLEEDARARSQQAESAMARLREEMRKDARAEAKEILDRARLQIRRERAQMRSQLKDEIARLAVGMARRITGKILTRSDHERIIRRVIGQLPRALGSAPEAPPKASPKASPKAARRRRKAS